MRTPALDAISRSVRQRDARVKVWHPQSTREQEEMESWCRRNGYKKQGYDYDYSGEAWEKPSGERMIIAS